MKKLFYIFIFLFFKFNFAYSLIEVDITRGNLDPLPIAVSPLHVDVKSEPYEGIKIKELYVAKLNSNLFMSVHFSFWLAVTNIFNTSQQEKNDNPKNRPRAPPNSDTNDVKSHRNTSFSSEYSDLANPS